MRGYRLRGESYELITDNRSEPLQLRLEVEGELIGFYRDSGEKLLIPEELAAALQVEVEARQQAEERATEAEERAQQAQEQAQQIEALLSRYQERFGELPE